LKAEHLKQGEDAENACCDYLKSQGLKLVDRNYNCRLGEIDIIMTDNDVLVFIEVRFRKNKNFGGGLESITHAKQQKIRRTAELYLQKNSQYKNARLDVVAMSAASTSWTGKQQYTFDWIKNAF
jgi:putative endonuclease